MAGSGAFHIAQWESGKRLTLAANENYRGGRAFVDSIEIEMGRAAKDRLLDLELGKADFAEIPPEEARRASERGVRVSASKPEELVALAFVAGRPVAEDVARPRSAVALDRPRRNRQFYSAERRRAGRRIVAAMVQWHGVSILDGHGRCRREGNMVANRRFAEDCVGI